MAVAERLRLLQNSAQPQLDEAENDLALYQLLRVRRIRRRRRKHRRRF